MRRTWVVIAAGSISFAAACSTDRGAGSLEEDGVVSGFAPPTESSSGRASSAEVSDGDADEGDVSDGGTGGGPGGETSNGEGDGAMGDTSAGPSNDTDGTTTGVTTQSDPVTGSSGAETTEADESTGADEGVAADESTGSPSSDTGIEPPVVGLEQRPLNATCVAPPRPTHGWVEVFTALERPFIPMMTLQAPDDDTRWFVAQRDGAFFWFDNAPDATELVPFGTIADRIPDFLGRGDDSGLYAMAFHPTFPDVGEFFVFYAADLPATASTTDVEVRISRFSASDESFDPASETILLRQTYSRGFELGGGMAFGPDGLLYVSLGSSGAAAQSPNSLAGKVLRIDVDAQDPGLDYAIPSDNPLVGQADVREEVYALGFRNPWRLSFDAETGELWVGDVGSSGTRDRQELDRVVAGRNYGWPDQEGDICYVDDGCAGFVPPVYAHDNTIGRTIVMGTVYRGSQSPELVGSILFGDTLTGTTWSTDPGVLDVEELGSEPGGVVHFAADTSGEVLSTWFSLSNGTGRFYALAGEPGSSTPFPQRLSETGCVRPEDPTRPAEGLIPYDVVSPLWSDGAAKRRWFALPEGTSISVTASGDLEFPVGAILMKEFRFEGALLETRLFMHHPDGTWAGYTYAWNDDETEADLLPGAATRDLAGGLTWRFPSRSACLTCHTASAGISLGPELRQLAEPIEYSTGIVADQLATLDAIGVFSPPLDFGRPIEALVDYADPTAPLVSRARAYLHSNCSGCHNPASPVRAQIDLRASVSEAEMGICDALPTQGDLGIVDGRIVAPGAPERSILLARIGRRGDDQMPPLGTSLVDPVGQPVLEAWVQTEACVGGTP